MRNIFTLSGQSRQRGVALITALLIVALATTIAAWLTNTHQLSIRRSGNIINGDQAYEYALGLEMLAIIFLNKDFKESNKTDGYSDVWALEIPPFPVEGGVVSGRVIDLQGLFNLNSLFKNDTIQTGAQQTFRNLLIYMQMDPLLTEAVIDWIDRDTSPRGTYGAEDDYYAGLDRPYRPANAPFASVSELRMVKGFDVKQFELLSSVLTVLPKATKINVNTAPMGIHIALGVDEANAEMLDQNPDKEERLEKQKTEKTVNPASTEQQDIKKMIAELESVNDYVQAAGGRVDPEIKKDLTVKSSYFLFEGEARIDRGYAQLKTILYRDNSGNIRVVMRTQGTL
jgi:general secretion pathway protein K